MAEEAGTTAEASAGGGCFPAGTPVATADGERPIETVQPGDLVLTADPDTGVQSYQRVSRTFIRASNELFRIELADGRSVEATGEHPFWVEGKGFVLARYLARSDLLRDEDGCRVPVVRTTSRTGRFTVYNFEVELTHTYYAAGWWVHNNCWEFNPVVDLDYRGTGQGVSQALNEAFARAGHPRSEFEVTRWGRDVYGKTHPVEWRHPSGAEVNIDFPHVKNGPQVPHVGYQTGGKRGGGGAVRGHILLDSVPRGR